MFEGSATLEITKLLLRKYYFKLHRELYPDGRLLWLCDDPSTHGVTSEDWKNWSDLNNTFENGYGSAKTKAEKAAFDYVEKLPAEKKFEIVSICPSYTFGPAINDQPYEINELLVKKILLN